MELDYEKDLYIDEGALDVECLDQATLMMRYSKAFAKAEKEVARVKEKRDVVRAELDRDIRKDPLSFQITTRVTEDVVKNAILLQDEFKEVCDELIDAQYEMSMLKGAVDSIKQRKDMLQELVKLHGQQYFAGPSIPRDLGFEAKQRHTKQTANSSIKITRRK